MKPYIYLLVGVLAMFGTAASASEFMFYERPVFMAENMPLKLECKHAGGLSFTCFETVDLPNVVRAKVMDKTTGAVRVQNVPVVFTAHCSGGICADQLNREPVGDVDFDILKGQAFYVQAIMGYYLDKNEKGQLVAYKRGFGPKADKYPPYAIFAEPVQHMSTVIATDTFDVTCSPHEDTCDLNGQRIDRGELGKHIPARTTEWCDMEFCYSNSSYDGVVGINPDGML